MSNQFNFKWRKAQTSSPGRKGETAPARTPEGRKEPSAAAKATQAVPAPAAERPRPRHEQIAVLAYERWEAQGRPEGADVENWFQAERELFSDPR